MTREEAIYFANCLKNNYTVDLNDMEAFCDMVIKALEQETVSKEVYDHEYFLRKEFELKIDKLQRQLDKIREQIKSHLRGVEITLEVLVENDPLRPKMEGAKDTLEECLEIIDKAESKEQE
jgi:hypothetical protein